MDENKRKHNSLSTGKEDSPPIPSRRDFITQTTGLALTGACLLSALGGGIRLALPDFTEGPSQKIPLGRLVDFKMNTLTWLQDLSLFVMRNHNGIGVFSSRCTHLGCTVQRTAEGFVCPCHGAGYGPMGEVLSGPARRFLPWYTVWFETDGRLWVDLDKPLDEIGPTSIVLPDKEGA